MLGTEIMEVGYGISTCQMQYDANNKETDKKIHASYTLEGMVLENVESIKYLGVTITNDLRWETYISNICTEANRTLGFMRRNLYDCPRKVKETAYKGLHGAPCPGIQRFCLGPLGCRPSRRARKSSKSSR